MRIAKKISVVRIAYLFICVFMFFTIPVHAYIDPSIMTYAIQAISGIAVALGTVGGLMFRKIRRKLGKDKKYLEYESDNLLFNDGLVHFKDPDQLRNRRRKERLRFGDRLADMLLIAFMFSLTIGFFYPAILFLGNASEIKLEAIQVLPLFAGTAAMVFMILEIVTSIFPRRIYYILSSLVFSAALCLFLQGTLLNPTFSLFNGVPIDWSIYTRRTILSDAVWLAVIIVSLFTIFKYTKESRIVRGIVSFFIIVVEAVSIAFAPQTKVLGAAETGTMTKKDEFIISKNKNTIVFIVDTLDTTWFEEYIVNENKYSDLLKDFTYFSEVVPGGAPTALGVPMMFTGVSMNPTEENRDEYYERAYRESSLFADIYSQGWKLKLYTSLSMVSNGGMQYVDNIITENDTQTIITDNIAFMNGMYKLALFSAMPMRLKEPFYSGENEMNKYTMTISGEYEEYSCEDDPQFYKDMQNSGVQAEDKQNCFIVYHLFGAHGPYSMDEHANRVETTFEHDAFIRQLNGAFFIVDEFINEMKAAGVYDDATIVICADHGGTDIYQNATVLVKRANETFDAMRTNDNYLTFANLFATYAKSVIQDESGRYGETLFEAESITDPRKQVADNILGSELFPELDWHLADRTNPYSVFWITGSGRDVNNIKLEEVNY